MRSLHDRIHSKFDFLNKGNHDPHAAQHEQFDLNILKPYHEEPVWEMEMVSGLVISRMFIISESPVIGPQFAFFHDFTQEPHC